MKATYVRVSTFEQNISRQLEGKEGQVYWDKVWPGDRCLEAKFKNCINTTRMNFFYFMAAGRGQGFFLLRTRKL